MNFGFSSGLQAWLRIPFWQRVFAGVVFGALAGWALGPDADFWFAPLGTVYVTLVKLIALPLVLFTVMDAVASLYGRRSMAALGGRTLVWFAVTAALAVCVGLGMGWLLQPGHGASGLTMAADYEVREVPSLMQVLRDMVPGNPLVAFNEGRVLQVIVFGGLVGFALVKFGERAASLRTMVGKASEMINRITRVVLETTPLGIFGLIAALVGAYGFEKLAPLGTFVFALCAACAVQIVFVYGGLLLAHGLNPLRFLRGAAPAMQIAFASSSSLASLPAAVRSVTHNLGVDQDYAAFAVPLGTSMKFDGCGAIYPALTSLFVAQYFGLTLEPIQYLIILLASVLGGFATAGAPGPAMVMTTLVLSAAGLPLEGIGYLIAIDRLLDMVRTMTNVTGQMLVPTLVARETGMIDMGVYNAASSNVGIFAGDERSAREVV